VITDAARRPNDVTGNCRGLLAFRVIRDETVSIERLETTIMYRVGGSRETNTTVLKLQIFTL